MNKATFFNSIKTQGLFSTLSQSQVDGIDHLLNAMSEAKWSVAWMAYALATAYHETAKTMQPIKEFGGDTYLENNYGVAGKNPSRARINGNTKTGDGIKYCGRGFVQLTWKNNYRAAGDAIGVDLVANPQAAMVIENASKILVWGMSGGKFTGRSLLKCLPHSEGQFAEFCNARAIINGTDKAQEIAGHAVKFQTALRLANS